jgi:hypothetical protein
MSCPCPVPYYLHSRTGQDFLYNFLLLLFFYRFLSKDDAKVVFFAQRVVVVFTTFNIDLQLSAGFARKRGKNGSRRLRKRP